MAHKAPNGSERLAAALARWPLDGEQTAFLRGAIAALDEIQAKDLVALLREAESAVISAAAVVAREVQASSVSERTSGKRRSEPPKVAFLSAFDESPTAPPASDQLVTVLKDTIVALVRRDDADLSMRQLGVLLTCYLRDGGHTVRGLAAELNVSKPAITRVLDRLGELDLARRKVDPLDRRSILVQRTLKGAAYLRELRTILMASAGPLRVRMSATQHAAQVVARA